VYRVNEKGDLYRELNCSAELEKELGCIYITITVRKTYLGTYLPDPNSSRITSPPKEKNNTNVLSTTVYTCIPPTYPTRHKKTPGIPTFLPVIPSPNAQA
jgi:hypothetical protein